MSGIVYVFAKEQIIQIGIILLDLLQGAESTKHISVGRLCQAIRAQDVHLQFAYDARDLASHSPHDIPIDHAMDLPERGDGRRVVGGVDSRDQHPLAESRPGELS